MFESSGWPWNVEVTKMCETESTALSMSPDKPRPFVFKLSLLQSFWALKKDKIHFHQHNELADRKLRVNFMSVPSITQAMVWFPHIWDKPAATWPCHALKRNCLKFSGPLFIGRPTLYCIFNNKNRISRWTEAKKKRPLYTTDLNISVTCSDTAESGSVLEGTLSDAPAVCVGAEVVQVKDGWLVCAQGELNSGGARLAAWAALVCCHHTELRNEMKEVINATWLFLGSTKWKGNDL